MIFTNLIYKKFCFCQEVIRSVIKFDSSFNIFYLNPIIERSTGKMWFDSPYTEIAEAEVTFSNRIRLP